MRWVSEVSGLRLLVWALPIMWEHRESVFGLRRVGDVGGMDESLVICII